MTDIVEAFRKILSDSVPVTTLVGTRILPWGKPLGAVLPLMFYKRISEVEEFETGICSVRMQLSYVDDGYLDALNGARTARQTLHGFYGTKEGIRINNVYFIGQTDDKDDTASGAKDVWLVNTDYQVVFRPYLEGD